MKRLLSIWFLLVLGCSIFGYRLALDLMVAGQEQQLNAEIARGIPESELVTLKVPVGLPYYTNSENFEQIEGEVTIEGTVYRYVQRRIYRDSIEYQCLRNSEKTKLLSARDAFFQLAFDLQNHTGKTSSTKNLVKPLMLEYCNLENQFAVVLFSVIITRPPSRPNQASSQVALEAPVQPPESDTRPFIG